MNAQVGGTIGKIGKIARTARTGKTAKSESTPKAGRRRQAAMTVESFVQAMEEVAPTDLAQSWDNVGLLAGDIRSRLRRVLLCIDLTPAVVGEARRRKADLVMAYHPPLFRPIPKIHAHSRGTDSIVYQCIRHGIAIYSTHTALDAAGGGTNDVIAGFCGLVDCSPLEYVDRPGVDEFKLVVFAPESDVSRVSQAMFSAGAGHIGRYSHCSYRSSGRGSFLGSEQTNPTVGRAGRLEFVDEIRLETVVPGDALPAVIPAMIAAHSYEEPAFDVYPLKPTPVLGIGRVGVFSTPPTLRTLARKLKRSTPATCVQTIGSWEQPLVRAFIVVGAAGELPLNAGAGRGDVIVTGEIRHHDALTMKRNGCAAVALGHWASERPVLPVLANRLQELLPGVGVHVSETDCDPFSA